MTQWTIQDFDNEGNKTAPYWINEYGQVTYEDPRKAPASAAGQDPNASYVWQGRYTSDEMVHGGKWVDVKTIKDRGDGWDPNSTYTSEGDYPSPGKVAQPAGYAAFDKTTPTPIFKTDQGYVFDGRVRSDWNDAYVARATGDANKIFKDVDSQHQKSGQDFADTVFKVGTTALGALGGATLAGGLFDVGPFAGGMSEAGLMANDLQSWGTTPGATWGAGGGAEIGMLSPAEQLAQMGGIPSGSEAVGNAIGSGGFPGGVGSAESFGGIPGLTTAGMTGAESAGASGMGGAGALQSIYDSPTTTPGVKEAIMQAAKAAGAVSAAGIDWGKVITGAGSALSGIVAAELAKGGPQGDVQKALDAYGNPTINFDPTTAYTKGGAGASGGVTAGTITPITATGIVTPAQQLAAIEAGKAATAAADTWSSSGARGLFEQQAMAFGKGDANAMMQDPAWQAKQQAVARGLGGYGYSGNMATAAANASGDFFDTRLKTLGTMANLGNQVGGVEAGTHVTQNMNLTDTQRAQLQLDAQKAVSGVSYQQNLLGLQAQQSNQTTATQRAQQMLEAEKAKADASYKSGSLSMDAAKINELARQFNAELTGKALGAFGNAATNIYNAQSDSVSSLINQYLKQQLTKATGVA